jgi:hypothetical protein
MTKGREMDEMRPCGKEERAGLLANELREVADVIEACPELADLPDWFDAAQRMLMDLDALDDPGNDL